VAWQSGVDFLPPDGPPNGFVCTNANEFVGFHPKVTCDVLPMNYDILVFDFLFFMLFAVGKHQIVHTSHGSVFLVICSCGN
jgi:hypothetical protein